MKKSVMVTGGAGFIGQNLSRLLRMHHDRVFVVDNFSTSRMKPGDFPLDDDQMKCQVADVSDPEWVKGWCSAHWLGDVREIYHLACPASPLHYQKTPVETLKTGLVGTVHVLEIAKALRCKVVIASTSEIYGDPEQHPQTESYLGNVSCVGPRSMYDEAKRAAEAAAWAYREQHGVDVRIARIFNTYGPGMADGDGRMIPNFIRQALAFEPITVYGDGEQTRSFCFVDDTVDALVRIMDEPRRPYLPIYNVGNPNEQTVKSVAQMIADSIPAERLVMKGFTDEVIGKSIGKHSIEFVGAAKDDPRRRCPDISRIKEQLGWEPQVDFAEGLRRTVEWFKDRQ